jgi:hypothetical protein
MSEILDRVARALAERLARFTPEELGGNGHAQFDPQRRTLSIDAEFNEGQLREVACFVLSAMREPTDALLAAHQVVPDDTNFNERAADNWRALIDAALDACREIRA